MWASRTVAGTMLAVCVAASLGAALGASSQSGGQSSAPAGRQSAAQAPKAPPKYPVKRELTPPEPPAAAPAPAPAPQAAPKPAPTAAPKPTAAPAPVPGPAPRTRYPVKTTPPAGGAVPGSTGPGTASAPAAIETPSASSFTAQGLTNEPSFTAIYRGDFSRSTITAAGILLPAAMQGYLTAFAMKCPVPEPRVEMLANRCATIRVVSGECVRWVQDEPTGLFADPDLYEAKSQLERALAADALRTVLQFMTSANPMGDAMGMTAQAEQARDDMARVVEMNACGGPGLKRFSDNLRRFALNQEPLKLEGQPAAYPTPVSPAAALPSDQDFARLIDDLIADQSRSWLVNRYSRGSVRAANVVSRNAQGQPTRIEASYSFAGFDGSTAGSLVLTFSDGAPNCIYFFDAPNGCRTPSRDIVSAYLGGRYAR